MESDRLRVARTALAVAEERLSASSTASGHAPPRETSPGGALGVDPAAPPGMTVDAARAIALRMLTAQSRSRAQIETRLLSHGCSGDVAGDVLRRLTDAGLVDDARYAREVIEARRRTSGLSKAALRRDLGRRGVADDIVDDALAEVPEGADHELARGLAAARLKALHGLDRTTQMRRLAGYLHRRGFDGALVASVVRDTVHDSPQHVRD